ncbi:MAG TPA: cyclic nucleotide-binding domain-containing protein [Candidatus Dormibacteraeota bacterium]
MTEVLRLAGGGGSAIDSRSALIAIAAAPILDQLPATEQRRLARAAVPRDIRRGEVLFRAGEVSGGLHLVRSGVVEIRLEGEAGHVPIAVIGPGDLVGVSAAAGDVAAPWSAVALESGEVITISPVALDAAVSAYPEVGQHLTSLFERRRRWAQAIESNRAPFSSPKNGRVIAVHSPRGGGGTTTVALGIAGILAQDRPQQVVVVDLSLPFGRCAYWTRSTPTTSLARIEQAPSRYRDDIVASAVSMDSGLGLLPAVLRPEEADLLTPEAITRAVQVLRREFEFVVIDVSLDLLGLVRAACQRADDIVTLTTPDFPSLRDTSAFLDWMESLRHRVRLLLNHPARAGAVGSRAIRRTLAIEELAELPHDEELVRASGRGERWPPLEVSSFRLTRSLESLTQHLFLRQPEEAETEKAAAGRRRWILG